MSRTVIVPLDGSKASEDSLPFARLLAERSGAALILMSVVEVTTEFDAWIDTAPFSLEEEMSNWIDERQEYLRQLAEGFKGESHTIVRVGRPADEIREVVKGANEPVLVMASHGRSGIQQFVLGSVALQIVHQLHCPVVTIHMQASGSPAPSSLDRILFPLDGSTFSEQIIEQALAIVGRPAPALHLTRVLEAPVWASHSFNAGLVGEYLAASRELIEEEMQELADRLTQEGYSAEWSIRDGNPGDQIIEAANACGAGLIAMATHGRGGLGRLLLGSVAQRVLHRTNVPLLLIHPNDDGE